jgi:hypothetical protein
VSGSGHRLRIEKPSRFLNSAEALLARDRLEPCPLDEMRAAGEELAALVLQSSPACRMETAVLGPLA